VNATVAFTTIRLIDMIDLPLLDDRVDVPA
jgi:hypothetical protein